MKKRGLGWLFNKNKENPNTRSIKETVVFFNKDELQRHTWILGTTREGLSENSNIKDVVTEKNGNLNKKEEYMVEFIREKKIKLAYLSVFDNIEDLKEEHYLIFEYSRELFDKGIESFEDFKVLFLNIPMHIFGAAISFGFDDTVVRDDLYDFYKNVEYKDLKDNYIKFND